MVLQLTSGKFVALEIGADSSKTNVYKYFRQLCGPSDPVSFLFAFWIEESPNSHILLLVFYLTGGRSSAVSQIDPREIRCQQSPKCHPLHGS